MIYYYAFFFSIVINHTDAGWHLAVPNDDSILTSDSGFK